MEEERKAQIKQYARTLNSNIPEAEDETLDFVLDEIIDRVMIYLNAGTINTKLDRILARILSGVFNKAKAEADNAGGIEREVKSMSDNGQSVTFGDEAKNYLANTNDEALFSGFENLLMRYREADCGNTGIIQNQDQ